MACSPFCSLLHALVGAVTALDAAQTPTLAALAQFGAEFQAAQQREEQPAEEGWSEVTTRGSKRHKVSETLNLV